MAKEGHTGAEPTSSGGKVFWVQAAPLVMRIFLKKAAVITPFWKLKGSHSQSSQVFRTDHL